MSSKRTPEILVVAAMREEISGLIRDSRPLSDDRRDPLSRYWEPSRFAGAVGLFCCGVGRKRVRRHLPDALRIIRPGRMLIAGYSGSLVPGSRTGDVVVAVGTCSADEPGMLLFDAGVTGWIISRLESCAIGHARGAAVTVDRIIDRAEDKDALRKRHDAVCVDMESGIIAGLPETAAIPVGMVRVISDAADESIGLDLNAIPSGKWPFRMYFLRHPHKIPALIRLKRDMHTATGRLSQVLNCLLAGDQARL